MTGYTNMSCWSLRLLLLGALLIAAAAQDTQEIQNEEDEEYFLTAGRGPPVNVTVMPVLVTALNVSWHPPEEEPRYYTVEIGLNNKVTYNTFYLQEGLQGCTDYSIVVTSVYDDTCEGCATTTQATTGISVPPPPQKCWFDVTDNTSIIAYWRDPSIQCSITNHNVSWWSHVLWNDEEGSGNARVPGYHYLIRDLQPYTNVTVSVAAATDIGYGLPTTCWNVTLQDTASEPVSFTVVNKTTSEAAFAWSPPQHLNGKLESWILVWTQDNGKTDNTNINSKVYKYVLKDLQSSTKYNVSLMAYNGAGLGNPATVEVTTDPDSVASNVGVIVGVTVSALMVIVIVGVGVFIYYRKKTLSNTPSDDRSNRGKRIWSGAAGNRSDSNSTISNNMVNDNSSSRYNDMIRGSAPGSEDYLTKAIEISKLNAIKQGSVLPRHSGITNGYASSSEDESINGSIYSVPIYEKPIYMQVVRAGRSRKAPQPPRQLELSTLSDDNTSDDTYPKGRRDQRLQRQNNIGMNGDSGLNRPREPYSRTSSRANNYPPGY